MTASDFVDLAKKMRRYRDKFVAHLDSEAKMDIPPLTAALAANVFNMGISLGWKPPRVTFLGSPTQAKIRERLRAMLQGSPAGVWSSDCWRQ
jgi:hypothetical protein